MNNEMKNAIEKLKEVKELLRSFFSRDATIKYLVEETKLTQEECSASYDFLMKLTV